MAKFCKDKGIYVCCRAIIFLATVHCLTTTVMCLQALVGILSPDIEPEIVCDLKMDSNTMIMTI